MPLVPPEFRGALAQIRPPHRVRRLGRQVLDPELDRIHVHLVGELVHHDLGDERALRMAGRAHRPLLARVDEHVLVRPAAIRDPIDVRQREAGRRAGAARAPRLGVERRDDAVGRHAGFDARGGRRPIAGREMLFLAIEHQLDRRVGLLREPGADQAFGADAQRLAAKAAAHVLADDADVGLRNAERGREVLARAVDALRRDPDRQLVAVPLAHGAVRLEADVRDDVRRVGFLERVGRRLEAGRQIAGLLRLPLAHVAAGEHRRRRPGERLLDDVTCGRTSYSTLTSRAASIACSSVSAATAATSSPWNITGCSAESRDPARRSRP